MTLNFDVLGAADIEPVLPMLAKLRIAVFRDFPYLYDGDLDYEQKYLRRFAKARGAVVIVASDGTRIVGAATGAPLAEVEADFAVPFVDLGHDIHRVFYCAESVLLPEYRGQGVGHVFFDHREAQAKALNADTIAFCSVLRPKNHPGRPSIYRPLDGFWRKRGYLPLKDALVSFDWRDVGESAESTKHLQVWTRSLNR